MCVCVNKTVCVCVCVHSVYIRTGIWGIEKKALINRHVKLAGEKWATGGLQLNSDANSRECRSDGFFLTREQRPGIKEATM